MIRLEYLQRRLGELLRLSLNGAYLSNISKFRYPCLRRTQPNLDTGIITREDNQEKFINSEIGFPYINLAGSVRCFNSLISGSPHQPLSDKIVVSKTYDTKFYNASKHDSVNKLHEYIKAKLEPYLLNAYLHGSISTLDYTGYSDLDTLFIIKQEVLEDSEKLRKLERLFIRSIRYLYEFDPLQHHGHFFLMEADLKFYSQAFLPLSVFKEATSLLGTSTELEFHLRDCQTESEERFIDSLRIIRRYSTTDQKKLKNPYHLKRVLSHFMILPALFLQVRGRYVSKKESFDLLCDSIPESVYQVMNDVSVIRRDWDQQYTPLKRSIVKLIGLWNPLLLPYFSQKIYKCWPVANKTVNEEFLTSMLAFTKYLYRISGLDEKKFKNQ